jgi:hypothetical protein
MPCIASTVGAAILGGVILGVASMLTLMHPFVLAQLGDAVLLGAIAGIIGGVVGLVSSPIIAICLRRKRLRHALPIVYIPAMVAVVALTIVANRVPIEHHLRFSFILSVLPAVGGLLILWIAGFFAWHALPNTRSRLGEGHCVDCDYDVRHVRHERCPECGLPLEGTALGTDAMRRQFRTSRWAASALTIALLLALGMAVVQWSTYIPFRPHRFAEVEPGMAQQQVRELIGKPHRHRQWSDGTETWHYDDGYGWGSGYYDITFYGGVVISTHTYDF